MTMNLITAAGDQILSHLTFMRSSCSRLATHYETLAVPQNATRAQIKVHALRVTAESPSLMPFVSRVSIGYISSASLPWGSPFTRYTASSVKSITQM